jgi:hypothetical protein
MELHWNVCPHCGESVPGYQALPRRNGTEPEPELEEDETEEEPLPLPEKAGAGSRVPGAGSRETRIAERESGAES